MKTILLIEDNKDMRENTSEILELSGYKVYVAAHGKEGVELALHHIPDLIICDIMMPILDGYGVLHLLSKHPTTASIPFIFLTAKADRSDQRKGMEMGADDYITKPFDDIELLSAIESRLKKSELIKQEFTRNMDGWNTFINSIRSFDELKTVSNSREIRSYKKKDIVYEKGRYPHNVFFIASGKVKTYLTNENGKEFITGLFKEGDFFGYRSLVEDTVYNDYSMAMEQCEICHIPAEEFFNLIYRNAEVARKFIRMLTDNIHEKEEQLLKLAYNSVRKRVAESLITLCNRYKKENESVFSMNIAREDIASLAGTATETTIRTLSDFRDENLVDIKGSVITILHYDKLAGMRN